MISLDPMEYIVLKISQAFVVAAFTLVTLSGPVLHQNRRSLPNSRQGDQAYVPLFPHQGYR